MRTNDGNWRRAKDQSHLRRLSPLPQRGRDECKVMNENDTMFSLKAVRRHVVGVSLEASLDLVINHSV